MKLYHIVAMAKNRVIGKDNKLPWHFPADLKRFKKITIGSTILMGRKTFESLGRPLPGRENFVLTHSKTMRYEGVKFFDSLEKALREAKTPQVFILGGETLFRETLDRIDGIWMTCVDGEYEGDAFYPELPADRFIETSREKCSEDPQLEFVYYERKSK